MTGSVQKPRASEKAAGGPALDEALEETFPASDPIACAPKRGGKDDKRADVAVNASDRSPDEPETTDAKTPSNMRAFHRAFERRRR